MKQLFTLLLAVGFLLPAQAQTVQDVSLPVTATITTGPASITLTWPNPGNASLIVKRRTKGQGGLSWQTILNTTGSSLTSLVDNGVAAGQIYEYHVERNISSLVSHGYVHVAVNANPVNSRGKILIVIDSATADAAGVELVRMKNDMRGDGWWPIPLKIGPSATVQSVKALIVSKYNADPTNTKAVLLIGNVPVPYSGNGAWDGHVPDHEGAWPCDAYYADVNGTWTDQTVNNTVPNRDANDNVPGDGKFDQQFLPSTLELQIGRIDFRHINAAAFGAADQVALLKRYLEKNHRWRTGQYAVQNKALVDDNFGYFSGEAFAANGYRNAYPLVGENSVVAADFFTSTDTTNYLMGFGCGGGWYEGAGGVGSSADFASDSVNIVFSNLFGSYFGDWDYETNPFMVAALASRGAILTCSWAGRPHHFYQALASGETIGYCMLETSNAQYNTGYHNTFGRSGAHIAMMGDPTLRANVVKPATNLTVASATCSNVNLSWTASAEAVTGYHIYRALSQDGPYTRLTTSPITGTTYTDATPVLDTLYYQVRAIKNQTNPGGGTYANNAAGPILQYVFTGTGGPVVNTTGGALNCNALNVTLQAGSADAVSSWAWSGPNNFSSSQQNPNVTVAGTYTVTATDATGCMGTATAVVVNDFAAPAITATATNIDCIHTSATITVNPDGLSTATISGPQGFFVTAFTATVTTPGTYTITATSATNGCIGNSTVVVSTDMNHPVLAVSNSGPITCISSESELTATSLSGGVTFTWSGPCLDGGVATCAGTYSVTATNPANGCSTVASTTVLLDVTQPTLTAAPPATLTCATLAVSLNATSNGTLHWDGPCLIPGTPPQANCAGSYTVVATNPDNGCTNSATVNVNQDITSPTLVFPVLDPLTCADPCLEIVVPNIPNIQLLLGNQPLPPGFVVEVCEPGIFQLTVQSLINGCTSVTNIAITEDITPPDVSAGPDKLLSCNVEEVKLEGSSTTPQASYLWDGPGGYSSTQAQPLTNVAGTYTLVVTNPENGCTAGDNVVVNADPSLPQVNITDPGPINCAHPSVTLSSGNNDPGATYVWTGPDNFVTMNPEPVVTAPGVYTVVVTVGNCSATGMIEVSKAPDFNVNLEPNLLGCDGVFHVCVAADGGTEPYQYLWSNGATTACSEYSGTAQVSVKVSDAGGCVFETQPITVVVPPVLQATAGIATINCAGATLCLNVTGGVAPYAVAWSDGQTGPCPVFTNGGVYSATVTDAAGCTTTVNQIAVNAPAPIAVSGLVTNESGANAHNGSIDITVTGGTAPYTYTWSNGATSQDVTGLAGNTTYTVIITDVNGCTQVQSYTVNTQTGLEESLVFTRLSLSPNPSAGLSVLDLKLLENSFVQVKVHDAAGRLVWESAGVETDVLLLPIDLNKQPSGLYQVAIRVDNQVFVRQLAVQR